MTGSFAVCFRSRYSRDLVKHSALCICQLGIVAIEENEVDDGFTYCDRPLVSIHESRQ